MLVEETKTGETSEKVSGELIRACLRVNGQHSVKKLVVVA